MKLKVIGSNQLDITRKIMVYPTLATVLEKSELHNYQLPVSPPQDLQCYQLPTTPSVTPPPLQRQKPVGRFAEIIASVVDDTFNIVCILLLLAVIHRLIVTDPKVKTVEVFNSTIPAWSLVTLVSTVGITVFIIAILTYIFFIVAATRSSGDWMFTCVFAIFPVMRISVAMASFIFIILLSSSSIQDWIGVTSTVMLLFVYVIIILDVVFTLLFLFAIISEKSDLKNSLVNLWTARNLLLLFTNLFLILFYLSHDNNPIFTLLTIFSVISSFIYIWVLWDWKLRVTNTNTELPKCGTMVLKIAIKLMEEDDLWIHQTKQTDIDDAKSEKSDIDELYETIDTPKMKFKVTKLDTLPPA